MKKYPHPALFGILILPFGASVGFLQVAAPWWFARAGLDLAQIAAISAVAFLPHAYKIFWCPLIDLGPHRKLWYLIASFATAALLASAAMVPDPGKHVPLLSVLLTASQAAAATASAALDALMATCARDEDKGRAGGWYMAGNVGGTGILGAAAIWLGEHFSPTAAGSFTAAVVVLSALPALTLVEPKDRLQAGSLSAALWVRITAIGRDLWSTLKSREGITGLIIVGSPVGCGALTNLFSAMAPSYNAPAETVELVSGVAGGVVGAIGSILGGYLADKINRRLAYAISGGITAVCAFAMALGPMNATTYTWGSLTYSFANGISYAAFAGLVLEMVSHGAAVTTKYTMFTALSNQAISYCTYLDGRASSRFGTRGSVAFDGILTCAGLGLLGLMLLVSRKNPGESVGAQSD
jgi:MFS transporter, PAT family, beta-lactamase induction signal transducer AmpG